MRVLLLSRYDRSVASSRYRALQYLPYLRDQGFEITVCPLFTGDYLEARYSGQHGRELRILSAYLRRVRTLLGSRHYDRLWVQKEALPWLPGWFEAALISSKTPVIADYDDAVFHRYDRHRSRAVRLLLGGRVDREMRQATLVIAGNRYLAERARAAGAHRIEILPTVVDLDRYGMQPASPQPVFTIGWVGTPHTAHYLEPVRQVLRELSRDGQVRLIAIGAGSLAWPDARVEVRQWSEATEVTDLQSIDVGIMPLPDSPWERGKCGLKLLQYMASGLPVVASPIGANLDIVRPGENGFLATTPREWREALLTLRADPDLRRRMGEAGRAGVAAEYCLRVAAPKLAQLLSDPKGKVMS